MQQIQLLTTCNKNTIALNAERTTLNTKKYVHVQSFYRYRIFAGIEYLFTLHGINEKISRFKRTYYACLLHV